MVSSGEAPTAMIPVMDLSAASSTDSTWTVIRMNPVNCWGMTPMVWSAFPRQEVMGFIQDDPMRTSGLGAKLLQLGEESGEEERPVRERKSQAN